MIQEIFPNIKVIILGEDGTNTVLPLDSFTD